ncbi:MAG: tRNA lysidine(34) synthetase TilS [Alphaproteobacteria bacterium]|nr:tRNA lysidine(34) synthetase TilS [Alphaproteobacteria bacterium]
MALMRLAAGLKPLVFTVDHGLRPESAGEAAEVGAWARALGLPHEILRWEGEKPKAGIQEAARAARYRLMTEAAGRAGARSLLTGHTLDDQIETVVMRAARGSGRMGLAGMPSQSEIGEGIRLVRPLLATRKAALVAWLEGLGQAFVVDPSNADRRFDRARLRGQGLDVPLAEIVAAQAARARAECCARRFFEDHLRDLDGGVAVDRTALAGLPGEARDLALGALLRRFGGRDHPGTRAERGRVATALCAPGAFHGRTLAGTHIRPAVARDGPGLRGFIVFAAENGQKPVGRTAWLPMGRFVQLAADGSFLEPSRLSAKQNGGVTGAGVGSDLS